MGGKLLSGIKSMHVDGLVCVIVKGDQNELFGIDSGVRQEFNMSPWLFNVYMDAVLEEVKIGMERRVVRFLEEWRE